jgi:hypothetical protein
MPATSINIFRATINTSMATSTDMFTISLLSTSSTRPHTKMGAALSPPQLTQFNYRVVMTSSTNTIHTVNARPAQALRAVQYFAMTHTA